MWHDFKTVIESFHDEKTTKERNDSVFDMRLPSSSSSLMSRNSAAQRKGAAFFRLSDTGRP